MSWRYGGLREILALILAHFAQTYLLMTEISTNVKEILLTETPVPELPGCGYG